mgnify:CR=1 FL=1
MTVVFKNRSQAVINFMPAPVNIIQPDRGCTFSNNLFPKAAIRQGRGITHEEYDV